MGAFDDLVSDIPKAANGAFNDLTQDAPAGEPLDPNSIRLDMGFGYNVDIPVSQNQTFRDWVVNPLIGFDNNVMAPLARGAVAAPGFLLDSLYTGIMAPEDKFGGGITQGMQDGLGIAPRPYDAGFGTDVLEAVGGGVMGGMASPGSAGQILAREVPAAVTSVVGQYAGGGIGEAVGGESGRKVGEVVGSLGGGMAPNTALAAGNSAAQRLFAKPNGQSGVAYDTLERSGITPTPGLVGNKQMARLENSAANFPVVGGIVQSRQNRAFQQFQNELYGASDMVGPRMNATVEQAMPVDMLGGRMRMAANEGRANLDQQFGQGYTDFYNSVPEETMVRPENLNAEVRRQGDRFTGESQSTQAAVQDFVRREIEPALVGRQGPNPPFQGPQPFSPQPLPGSFQGPRQPGAPIDTSLPPDPAGVPIQVARRAGTEAFYDAQGGRMGGGAIEQVRGAWNADIENALMNDPNMIAAFPDDAARAAQVERLRVLNTEYAMAGATDISRAGTSPEINGRLYVGGDKPGLDRIANAVSDQSAYNMGSEPGHMAVLQRTAPNRYPGIAAEVIRNEAQSRQPFGDTNVSPQVFATWWNSLSPNEKLIFTNERSHGMARSIDPTDPAVQAIETAPTPTMDRLDNLGQAGELFRQAGAQANPSGTAPTLATMGVMTGLFTHPVKTIAGLASGGALSRIASSPTTARVIAGRGPTTGALMIDALVRGMGRVAAQQGQPDYGGPR